MLDSNKQRYNHMVGQIVDLPDDEQVTNLGWKVRETRGDFSALEAEVKQIHRTAEISDERLRNGVIWEIRNVAGGPVQYLQDENRISKYTKNVEAVTAALISRYGLDTPFAPEVSEEMTVGEVIAYVRQGRESQQRYDGILGTLSGFLEEYQHGGVDPFAELGLSADLQSLLGMEVERLYGITIQQISTDMSLHDVALDVTEQTNLQMLLD